MAITAWSAKVCSRAICLSLKGCTSVRRSTIAPILSPSRSRGTLRTLRMARAARHFLAIGELVAFGGEDVMDVHRFLVEERRVQRSISG